MATTVSDGVVGAMATDIARKNPESRAPTLLVNAVQVTSESHIEDDIRIAAHRAGLRCTRVLTRLAPEAAGWRDRLAEIEDWGSDQELAGTWEVIDGLGVEEVRESGFDTSRLVSKRERANGGRE